MDTPMLGNEPYSPGPGGSLRRTRRGFRLLLVDDHRVMRQGLASLLSGEPDVVVVGEAPDGLTAVELTRTAAPDVTIMDVSMPGMNGIEATRIITAEHPHTRVIGLSMHEESSMSEQMLSAGAAAYLIKAGPLQALLAAIRGRDQSGASGKTAEGPGGEQPGPSYSVVPKVGVEPTRGLSPTGF